MIANSTNKLINCFKHNSFSYFRLINCNKDNSKNNNNTLFYNKRLYSTLNNSNSNNNNNNKNNSDSNNDQNDKKKEIKSNNDEEEDEKLSEEEKKLFKEKVEQIVNEIEKQQKEDDTLGQSRLEDKGKTLFDLLNQNNSYTSKKIKVENEQDEDIADGKKKRNDDLETLCKFYYSDGTTKNKFVMDNTADISEYKLLSKRLELTVESGKDQFMEGIRSIFSFFENYSNYIPVRNTPLLNPFIFYCPSQCNYLFEKNPFFIIQTHNSNEFFKNSLFNNSTQIPSTIDKDEFLEESSKALKQIYKLAENQKSLELQKISSVPSIANLLLLRDIYYTVGKASDLEFNVDDISIDNFEFEPINCKAYFDFNKEYLILESTYRVVSNKYDQECLEYPVYVTADWITQFNEQEIDWRILNITFSTDYDPQEKYMII